MIIGEVFGMHHQLGGSTEDDMNKMSVIGHISLLYYARAVDMTVLMSLSSIAVEQTKATEKTLGRCLHCSII